MVQKRKKIFFVLVIFVIFAQLISYPLISKGESSSSSKTTTTKSSTTTSAGQASEDKLGLGNLDEYQGKKTNSTLFRTKLKVIFTALRIVGTVLSVIILIVIGLKYMLGSVEERANYKKTLVPYLWGTFFLFATSVLPQMIYELMQNIGWL